MHCKVLCVQKLWFFYGFVVQSVQNGGGESDESAGCGKRGRGLFRSALLLPLASCCRDGVLTLSATPWGRGARRCSRRSREQREAAAKAAAFAALRETQCGARAAPRRFRRGAPNGGDLHLCGKRGVWRGGGGSEGGESRGEHSPNRPNLKIAGKMQKTFDIYSPI